MLIFAIFEVIKLYRMRQQNTFWSKDFISLTTANLLMAITFYFMLPVLPEYLVNTLHASNSEVGITLASYTIAALAIRLFAGWTIDSYNRKIIYLSAFLLYVLSFAGYPLASGIAALLFIRFAHGLTWGVLTTSSSTIAVDIIPPKRRGEGIGIFGLSMTIGMAIGPMIAIAIAGNNNYSRVFYSAIALSFIGFILALTITYPISRPKSARPIFSFKNLIEKSAIPISLLTILILYSYGGILSFIVLYGKQIGIESSGLFFLILSVGLGLSRVGSGKFFDLYGPKIILPIGIIILICGFAILSFIRNSVGFLTSGGILGLGYGIIMPTFQAMINNICPADKRGAANSTFLTAFDLGIGLGMIGFGFLTQWLGFTNTFIISLLVNAFSLLLLLGVIRHYHKTRKLIAT